MEDLLKRAESGDVAAIEEVANSYYRGLNGFPEDNEKALYWYNMAVSLDSKNVVCLNGLGNIYYCGYGVPVDTEKGVAYYLEAANLDYGIAQFHLASHLDSQKNPQCVSWYEKAFKNGQADAAFKLYCIYDDGEIVEKDAEKGVFWLKEGSESGNASCQLALACKYLSGKDCEMDYHLAAKWMTAAAENGSSIAMNNLALMYEKGEVVEQDYAASDEWAIKAAKSGDASQLKRHALLYADGDGFLPQSSEKAIELFQIGADTGDNDCEYCLAMHYIRGVIVEKNLDKAVSHLEAAGKRGHKLALDVLKSVGHTVYGDTATEKFYAVVKQGADDGYYQCMVRAFKCLINGDGVAKDESLALQYLQPAVDDDYKEAVFLMGVLNLNRVAIENPSPQKALELFEVVLNKGEYDDITAAAHRNIGLMYLNGNGVPKDTDKAITHLEDAAQHGDTQAIINVALAHDDGGWANLDYQKAVTCYQQLHDSGNSMGSTRLGFMYENGHGIEQDYAKAANLYSQAAEQGNTRAMISLALMLQKGEGIEKNPRRAFELLQEAFDAGDKGATMLLGGAYLNGEGTDKDIRRAISLFEKSAKEGDEEAKALIKVAYMDSSLEEYIDPQKAIDFLRPYADNGDSDAMFHLAERIYKSSSYEQARDWFVKAAKAGSTDAQYAVGLHAYMFDELNPEIIQWLSSAAEHDHVGALNCMGDILMLGNKFIAQNRQRAFECYKKAANQGNAHALYRLGACYLFGRGTPENPSKGFPLVKRAVSLGEFDALDMLGDCYYRGLGVAKDVSEAIKCYEKGTDKSRGEWCRLGLGTIYADLESGYFNRRLAEEYLIPLTKNPNTQEGAIITLGLMYIKLDNLSKAIHWFTIAADNGSSTARHNLSIAQHNLGVKYYNGDGVEHDLDKAEFYFTQAAENGHSTAASDAEDCRRLKMQQEYQHQIQSNDNPPQASSGCYIATAVYGSYDCPEVWTLRRFRDYTLAKTWYGRLFIRIYYAVSPTIVKYCGHTRWFNLIWKHRLDKMVSNLQNQGVDSTPYDDNHKSGFRF